MVKLTEEAKRLIVEFVPVFVATANKDGKPNVAPKGPLRILDDEHIIFAEMGRFYTLANLRENPQLSVIAFDHSTSKGCRIWGKAKIIYSGNLFETISTELTTYEKIKYLVEVTVEEVVTF